jgi:hypothetical protein
MDIVFSANNNEEIMILPVVPNDIPIQQGQENEQFQTMNNGTLNLIGELGLRSLSIQSFFPVHAYRWIKKGASSDGWSYIEFFKKWRKKRVPMRIIITSSTGKEILNMACTIDDFEYGEKRNGDIAYSLSIREYRFVSTGV